jgi:hypothetical protein
LIVAAGHFNASTGAPIGPTYQNLKATPQGNGLFLLTFGSGGARPDTNYVNPLSSNPPAFMYIVNGTLFGGRVPTTGLFSVMSFLQQGIQVRVLGPTAEDSFMVEVSLFGRF